MTDTKKGKLSYFKNKRLQFVLVVAWLIACFIFIRIEPVGSAKEMLNLSLSNCYEFNKSLYSTCTDDAIENYSRSLKITKMHLVDLAALFLIPIILIMLLVYLVRWINNYKVDE